MASALPGFAAMFSDRIALEDALERRRQQVSAQMGTPVAAPPTTTPQAARTAPIYGASRVQAYLQASRHHNPIRAHIALRL